MSTSYSEGQMVLYQCIEGYVKTELGNTTFVCRVTDGKASWIGSHFECKLALEAS